MSQLINNLKESIPDDLISIAADSLVERETSIEMAVEVMVPTLIYGLASKTSSRDFRHIFTTLKHKRNISFELQLDRFLSEEEAHFGDPREVTKRLSDEVFGKKIENLHEVISGYADVKPTTSSALLNLVCPAVMAFLSKKIADENMDANSFSTFLDYQKPKVEQMLPAEMEALFAHKKAGPGESKSKTKAGICGFFYDFFKGRDN